MSKDKFVKESPLWRDNNLCQPVSPLAFRSDASIYEAAFLSTLFENPIFNSEQNIYENPKKCMKIS